MPQNRSIIRSTAGVSTGGASDWLFFDSWPSDVDIDWYRITALDRTTDLTRIELLFRRGAQDYVITSQDVAAAAYSVSIEGHIRAPGDFRVGARFVGATAADVLELYAYGEVVEPLPAY